MKKGYLNSKYLFINRNGGLNFYTLILALLGLGIAIFVFLPEYTSMQNGIYNVSCGDIRSKIDSAVSDYNVNNSVSYSKPGLAVDLDTLKEKGYLREIKYCPQKGQFLFNRDGKVICTIHSKGGLK